VISQESPGYQAMGRQKDRRARTESSKVDTDEMTDYLPGLKGYPASRKYRRHRRSQPVTREDFERLQRRRTNPKGQRGRTGYAQFANAGAPMYFQSGNGNVQDVPVMQVPMPTRARQQQGEVEEVMTEVSSNPEMHPQHRQSPARRQHSRSSSSNGGR